MLGRVGVGLQSGGRRGGLGDGELRAYVAELILGGGEVLAQAVGIAHMLLAGPVQLGAGLAQASAAASAVVLACSAGRGLGAVLMGQRSANSTLMIVLSAEGMDRERVTVEQFHAARAKEDHAGPASSPARVVRGFSPHKVKTHIWWIMKGCWSALPRTTRGTVSSDRASFRMDRHCVPACWHAVAMALHRGR
ncbi:hypothetical protein [Nonomuraea sp. NPDC049625]|uniref:hypothetical protein n=1 Tax=Nonomuraea sp. NPDC049625 TaxID=3155775 RepID=UPI003424C9AE